MTGPRKIVLHSVRGLGPGLAGIVEGWIHDGVQYVGIVGQDAEKIEDAIDDLCVGVGTAPYFMTTVSHSHEETLEDAVFLADQISTISGSVAVVEL